MEQRRIIDEKIILNIPTNPNKSHDYKPGILWEELIATQKVLPTDIISEVGYREQKSSGFGQMDDERTYYTPTLVVIRKRPETDDEFLARKKSDEFFNSEREEREKLEYLRLKAKFEKS